MKISLKLYLHEEEFYSSNLRVFLFGGLSTEVATSHCHTAFRALLFTLNLTHSLLVAAMSLLSTRLKRQLDVQLCPGD